MTSGRDRRSRAAHRLAIALAASSLAACSSNKQSPLIGDCMGPDCNVNPGGGSAGGSGTSGTSAGGSGTGGTITDAGTSATVAVRITTDDRFSETQVYGGHVRVGARGTDGAEIATTGIATGLELDGLASGVNWFAITDDPAGAGNLFPTLEPASLGPTANLLGLTAVPAEFSLLYLNFGLSAPDPTTAQAIVTFQSQGAPVAGVKLEGDVADAGAAAVAGTAVAYDSAGGYELATSASTSTTGPFGTALLIDWTAGPYFPGRTTTLVYTVPGSTDPHATDIVLANGFVTLVTIALQ